MVGDAGRRGVGAPSARWDGQPMPELDGGPAASTWIQA